MLCAKGKKQNILMESTLTNFTDQLNHCLD